MMRAETALAEYEDARKRLPPARRPGLCRAVPDLEAIADRFDTFLLDAFGVLNIGEEAIAGVPERIAALQAAGKRVMVLTNTASVPHAALIGKYARLGYEFAPEDVVSSRDAALSELRLAEGQRWGVMALPELQDGDLDALPLVFLGDEPAPYEAVDGFLFLGSQGWTAHRQDLLEAAIRARPRELWVGNPDIVAPRSYGFSVEPGHYAHALADRTGISPRFFGKPFRNIYELAFARMGGAPDLARTVMVGDSLHTDILGAQTAGVASALVAGYGFFAGGSVQNAIVQTGIAPDYILARP